jgi:hypothetical protein
LFNQRETEFEYFCSFLLAVFSFDFHWNCGKQPTRPKIAFEKIEGSVQDFKSGFVVWVIAAARKREQDQQTSRFCASAETWRFEDCRQLGERSANCETLRRWL